MPQQCIIPPVASDISLERHLTVVEVAQMWGLHRSTIERIFYEEPGVLKLERPETRRKRRYVTMRIPESVVGRVHERLRGGASAVGR